jgi:hypothetical protein
MRPLHRENHLIERICWFRTGILCTNDGIVSTVRVRSFHASAESWQKTRTLNCRVKP